MSGDGPQLSGSIPAMSGSMGPPHNSVMTPASNRMNRGDILRTPRGTGQRGGMGGFVTPGKSSGVNVSDSMGRNTPWSFPGRPEIGTGHRHLLNIPDSAAPLPSASLSMDTPAGNGEANVVKTVVWGTDINLREVQRLFASFVREFRTQVGKDDEGCPILSPEPKYFSYLQDVLAHKQDNFSVDCADLNSFSPHLYANLCNYPREIIPLMDEAVSYLAKEILEQENQLNNTQGSVGGSQVIDDEDMPQINVRPYNLMEHRAIRDLDPNDVERLVQVNGMVTRASNVMPDMRVARFACEKCNASVWIANESAKVKEPTKCESCSARNCMKILHNQCLFSDKQLIKMQESPNLIPEGETPHTVTAFAYDTLVDFVRPGDRVTLVGVYRALPVRENPRLGIVKSVLRTYVDVLHIEKNQKERIFAGTAPVEALEQRPRPSDSGVASPARSEAGSHASQDMDLGDTQDPYALNNLLRQNLQSKEDQLLALGRQADIYEKLTASLAPSIWEMDDVKKGILCQLFGAVNKGVDMKARNMINILLVGDPGVSKSQLLTYVHKVAPRGIYTSGRGSSAVGLTAYVTRDPDSKEHVLESGALVLSDQGICCIDEFDKMSDSARAMLHEVMEQQTVSVAKAGIIATLNARTSVLAAANPKSSRYDPRQSIVDNINLPPSLLSRFDLIYLLLDKADPSNDQRLARHLASLYWAEPPESVKSIIPLETLKEYIAFCRTKIHPKLGDEACMLLASGYLDMRMVGQDVTGNTNRNVVSATPRQLESLVRLSESLARMELQEEVHARHVQEAIRLMTVSMQQSAMDQRTGMIDMDKIYSGVGALDRQLRNHLAGVVAEVLRGNGREMTILEIANAINSAAGQGGVKATHALVQSVLSSMENIHYDSARGRARAVL